MDSGLVEGQEARGRRVLALTEAGREHAPQQWDDTAEQAPSAADEHHSPLRARGNG
ncbi:hypothetical protein OHB00_48735 [Streptomyces sp. NBC_00631]|uniref:hypothetical protein n=1 Tax=Streptomyces sp. NBC_00631 TaxID=2975793 RepID=UPI0030E1E3B0